MLGEFYAAGWRHSGDCGMLPGSTGFYLSLDHASYPDTSLSIVIYLNDMPAITVVNLTDCGGVIDCEWQDTEIDVSDITRKAESLQETEDNR